MVFRIYTDKIRLVNDNEEAVAQIDFPEVSDGVCEIAHIYGERSAQGKEIANQMMDMAVKEIRSSGRKVNPACAFAKSWFSQHPEDADLIAVSQQDPAPQQEPAAAPSQAAPQKEADGRQAQEEELRRRARAEQERRRQAAQEDDYDDEPLSRRERRRQRQEEAYEEEMQTSGKGTKILSRILMVICALCMAGVIYYVGINAYGSMSSLLNGSLVSLGATGGFLLFCIIEFFWIFTKKKYYYDEFERPHRVDKGRGLFAFIIVLIVGFLCLESSLLLANVSGIDLFISVISNDVNTIMLLGIVGFLLSIARKLISR